MASSQSRPPRGEARADSTRPSAHSGRASRRARPRAGALAPLAARPSRRGRPLARVLLAASFVLFFASLLVSLQLRTQMAENSYRLRDTDSEISILEHDIQDSRYRLEQLGFSLPDTASSYGMVPGSDSITLDLGGGEADSDGADAADAAAGEAGSDTAGTAGDTGTTDGTDTTDDDTQGGEAR